MYTEEQTIKRKENVLKLLNESLGIITTACEAAGVPRKTFYQWMKEDDEFRDQVEDIKEVQCDFVEGKLLEQIEANVPSSTIFYLKTKGKNRGYVERFEVIDRTVNYTEEEVEQLRGKAIDGITERIG